ncbi:ribonuclease HI [Virgibacillus natechei]|uniref:Ribonuclease H n=1 Tax=Virgibacillus natechei TaxID=1216297 RepID=A0ABS4IHU5_9BACI|nr:ribonuclease H family protein [Virgibacillus natechei]MBP1970518.1 ribonuclease HI [Virgibacillus natechei]UZD14078.1 ribonuclease H family protein [Virgibacillus natechei]
MAKKKYYVVWSGNKTGIFDTWEECKKQVLGVKGARYKSFPSKEEAEIAFKNGSAPMKKSIHKKESSSKKQSATFIEESISVDAACSGNPGVMEYKGVYTKDGKEIFHFGPVSNGTNNIGEFLAIVHALALMKEKDSTLPVYSDSRTAISWVRKKHVNTTIPRNESTEYLWKVIDRAITWLNHNTYSNKILKWETKLWGESKADFGRKTPR